MRFLWPLILAVTVGSASLAAINATQVVQMRQANFKHLLQLDRAVRRELAGSSPNAIAVGRAAILEEQIARAIPSTFPPGNGPTDGIRTYARAEVWQNGRDFRSKANDLVVALEGLRRTAEGGNADRMRAQHENVANACQACHRSYLARF